MGGGSLRSPPPTGRLPRLFRVPGQGPELRAVSNATPPRPPGGTLSRHGPGLINGTTDGGLAHNHRCGLANQRNVLVGQAARTRKRQARARAVRSQTVARLTPGHPAGARPGADLSAGCKTDGGGVPTARWPCPGPAPKDWRRPWNQSLSSGAAGLRPARFSRSQRDVGSGALWGRLAALARPTGRPSLLFSAVLSAT